MHHSHREFLILVIVIIMLFVVPPWPYTKTWSTAFVNFIGVVLGVLVALIIANII